ncbi:MAG: D-lyxose/D-mannose family sugar isomerase, partial [Phycisphaeraceae bacterium]
DLIASYARAAQRLGWDVTDFGSGDLVRIGRTIFTLRNGKPAAGFPKSYAEKVMHLPPGQRSITHYHKQKREDIVCRGGRGVGIKLWKVADDGGASEEPLELAIDGVARTVAAGEEITLAPGESIHVPPRTYHQFYGLPGEEETLSVEVSSVCDDEHDNFFIEPFGERFPEIIEDEPPRWVQCREYGNPAGGG